MSIPVPAIQRRIRPEALQKLPPDLVAAAVRNAELQAVMAVAVLDAIDCRLKHDGFPDGAQGLPLGFLLELGAICQLFAWEQSGLAELLKGELPLTTEATRDLAHRAKEAPSQFRELSSARLTRQIVSVALERLAWSAPNLLGADVVLGEVDEDALVEALAQLLWKHRKLAGSQDQQTHQGSTP